MSQWAAIETPSAKFEKYEFDVSFVGGAHVTRKWFVSELQKRGINVACFGHGWPNGSVSSTRMYEIFRRSKINLNLSNSKTLDIRFLLSSLKNLYIGLRASKDAPQVKARNFEILQAGGFQISDYVPSLEMYLDIGKDIVCYKNVEEAAMLINYYLKMEEEREQIRAQGEQTVRQGHTYTHRLLSMMKEVFS
jgi:spore maturation protein CgeB